MGAGEDNCTALSGGVVCCTGRGQEQPGGLSLWPPCQKGCTCAGAMLVVGQSPKQNRTALVVAAVLAGGAVASVREGKYFRQKTRLSRLGHFLAGWTLRPRALLSAATPEAGRRMPCVRR